MYSTFNYQIHIINCILNVLKLQIVNNSTKFKINYLFTIFNKQLFVIIIIIIIISYT